MVFGFEILHGFLSLRHQIIKMILLSDWLEWLGIGVLLSIVTIQDVSLADFVKHDGNQFFRGMLIQFWIKFQ